MCSVVLITAAAHASPNPAGISLSLGGEYRTNAWLRQWGAFLSVTIPLERLAAPRVRHAEPTLTEDPPKKENETAPPPADPGPSAASLAVSLSPRLARGTVRHALATAGYFNARARLSSLSSRARSSAALPELALRTSRSTGQTLRLTPTSDDPYRYTQAGTSELSFEARLTWHLDRLVFADEEVSIERLQNERDAAQRRLIDHVLGRLALWQRARVRAGDPNTPGEERELALLESVGAAVELDVLTDGWFSQAIGESEGPAAGSAGESAKVEVHPARHAR